MKIWKLTNGEFEPRDTVEDGVWIHAFPYEEVEPLVKTAEKSASTVIAADAASCRLFVTDKYVMTVSEAEAGEEVRRLVKALLRTFIQPKFATVEVEDLLEGLRAAASFHVVNRAGSDLDEILPTLTKAPGLEKTKSAVVMVSLSAEGMACAENLHAALKQAVAPNASLVWCAALSDGENGFSAAMLIGDEGENL